MNFIINIYAVIKACYSKRKIQNVKDISYT
jgi:hypothetical protein